ncbi:hypothetical protein D3C71_1669760 [compost metagenome]
MHDSTVHGSDLEVSRDIVAGNDIDNDVNAVAVSALHDLIDEVLFVVIYRHIGPQVLACNLLLFIGDGCENFRGAKSLGQHGRGSADAGGASVDKYRIACFELTALKEIDPYRHEGFRNSRSFLHGKPSWQMYNRPLIRHGVLGISTAWNQRHDLVAGREARDFIAYHRDHT